MKKALLVASAISAMVLASVATGYSASFTYYLDYEFSGAMEPEGTPPWLTLTFDDEGTAGSVKMTLTGNLILDEFIQQGLYFNFDPAMNASLLTFTYDSGYDGVTVFKGTDAFKADGDGDFDIKMEFDNAPPADRFGIGDSMVWDITLAGITAASFNYISVNGPEGKTGFHAAAHIGGIGEGAAGSGWIGDSGNPVPEPATMLLFGTGLIGLAGIGRKKRS